MLWRKDWKHVKTVTLYSVQNNETREVSEWTEVVLLECARTKKRKYEKIGDWSTSPAAKGVRAAIIGWFYGGAIPEGMTWTGYSPPPKPRKPLPGKKKALAKVESSDPKAENVVQFPEKKTA